MADATDGFVIIFHFRVTVERWSCALETSMLKTNSQRQKTKVICKTKAVNPIAQQRDHYYKVVSKQSHLPNFVQIYIDGKMSLERHFDKSYIIKILSPLLESSERRKGPEDSTW